MLKTRTASFGQNVSKLYGMLNWRLNRYMHNHSMSHKSNAHMHIYSNLNRKRQLNLGKIRTWLKRCAHKYALTNVFLHRFLLLCAVILGFNVVATYAFYAKVHTFECWIGTTLTVTRVVMAVDSEAAENLRLWNWTLISLQLGMSDNLSLTL